MYKKAKRMIAMGAVVATMLSISIMPVYADTDYVEIGDGVENVMPSANYPSFIQAFVELTTGERWDYSSYLNGNYAKAVNGNVDRDSALSVWFVIESGTGGHHDVAKKRVMPGTNCPEFDYKGPKAEYRLELNPYGTETNRCIAEGYIRVSVK